MLEKKKVNCFVSKIALPQAYYTLFLNLSPSEDAVMADEFPVKRASLNWIFFFCCKPPLQCDCYDVFKLDMNNWYMIEYFDFFFRFQTLQSDDNQFLLLCTAIFYEKKGATVALFLRVKSMIGSCTTINFLTKLVFHASPIQLNLL